MKIPQKKRAGIFALSVLTLFILIYTGIVVTEFFVSRYGETVDAKVAGVSHVCRHKNKHVVLLVESRMKRVRLYGTRCREKDYVLGSTVQVRINRSLNILVVPGNLDTTRLIVFSVFSVLLVGAFILTIRDFRKTKQTQ